MFTLAMHIDNTPSDALVLSGDLTDRGGPQSYGFLRRTVEPYSTGVGARDFSRVDD